MVYDIETSGLEREKHSILQIAARIIVEGKLIVELILDMEMEEGREISQKAMEVTGIDLSAPGRISQREAFFSLYRALRRAIPNYRKDKSSRLFLAGYNSAGFDTPFFRSWWDRMYRKYVKNQEFTEFFFFFRSNQIDAFLNESMCIDSSVYDTKLVDTARRYGISVDEELLHDAGYDLHLTELILQKQTGEER